MDEEHLDNNDSDQHIVYSSSILFEKPPLEAMEALAIRRQQAKFINKEISDWLTSYGKLRLHYVDELRKLQKKANTLFDDQSTKLDALGLVKPMWSDLLKNIDHEATYFDQSTRKMGRDMIAPLRLFTRNKDTNLVEMDQLIEIANHLHNNPNPTYEDEWTRKAPYFFEIFENYDYERLLLLKDVFLKYQTDLGDVVNKFKKNNEAGMEHVLNFVPEEEIDRFSKSVIATSLPIENARLDNDTGGFTSSVSSSTIAGAAGAATESFTNSNPSVSKRHSMFFHHKKDTDSVNSDNKSKRLSSVNSMFSSNTLVNNEKKKEKAGMRSKFGSMFKKNRKGKDSSYAPPSTIHEPDTESIRTASTMGSAGNILNQRQRNQSRSENTSSPSKSSQMPSANNNSPPTQSYGGSLKKSVEQQKQDAIKPLPQQPVAEKQSLQQEQPHNLQAQQNYVTSPQFQQNQQRSSLSEQPQQQRTLYPADKRQSFNTQRSESSLYQTMAPTKRSDSISSTNVQMAVNEAITSATNTEMQNIPEAAPLVTGATIAAAVGSAGHFDTVNSAAPPPPPSSRKHIATNDYSISSSTSTLNSSRQPHGNAPVPPGQRKSVSLDGQNNVSSLQPAPTGSQRSETVNSTLARNTTGGGGLIGGQILHPALTSLGLNSSIVELFNASFKDGSLVRSNAIGEIAFSFIVDDDNKKLPSEITLQIRSKKDLLLPNFMVNPTFLQQSTEAGFFNIFDPSQVAMRTVGGLKYMLNNPTPPIVVTPIWKHEDNQSTVIISVRPVSELDEYLANESLTLTNFIITVSVANAVVSAAATKPAGSLNKEKGRVTWLSQNTITFNSDKKEERFVARFTTNQRAAESDSGVQVRFNISNDDGAGRIGFLNTDLEIKARSKHLVEDPFGDGTNKEVDDWSDVPTLKSLVAGNYTAHT